jgi:hypothetical protein
MVLVHLAVRVSQLVIVPGHKPHEAGVEVDGWHAEGHADMLERVHEIVNSMKVSLKASTKAFCAFSLEQVRKTRRSILPEP